jgi:hypothetical protein
VRGASGGPVGPVVAVVARGEGVERVLVGSVAASEGLESAVEMMGAVAASTAVTEEGKRQNLW